MTQPYPQQPYDGNQPPQQPGQWGPPQGYPGGAYPPPPVPPKKRRTGLIVGLVILGVIVLGFAGCLAVFTKTASDVASTLPGGAAATVTYTLEGSGKATTVTYNVGSVGGVSQQSEVALPWTKEVQFAEGSFRVAALSAQNAGSGDLTCRITIDGKVVREVTSSGRYAVVSCASEAF